MIFKADLMRWGTGWDWAEMMMWQLWTGCYSDSGLEASSGNKMLVLIVSSFGWFLVLPSRNCRVGIFLSWQSCCLISIPSFSLPGPPLSRFLRASYYFSRVLDPLKMQYWLSRSVWGPRACDSSLLPAGPCCWWTEGEVCREPHLMMSSSGTSHLFAGCGGR